MSRNRAKGTRLETEFVDFAQAHGFPHARRMAAAGALDQGDVALADGVPVTIEVKNHIQMDLATWMKEAQKESVNAGTYRYVVAHNRRGAPTRENYATVPWWFLLELLQAFQTQTAPKPMVAPGQFESLHPHSIV